MSQQHKSTQNRRQSTAVAANIGRNAAGFAPPPSQFKTSVSQQKRAVNTGPANAVIQKKDSGAVCSDGSPLFDVFESSRDLANVPFGGHQYTSIVANCAEELGEDYFEKYGLENMVEGEETILRDLGGGKQGFVLGAHNVDGKLTPLINEDGDLTSAREFNNPEAEKRGVQGGGHWSNIDGPVDFSTFAKQIETEDSATLVGNMLTGMRNFDDNMKLEGGALSYPFLGLGTNSNSFNQSLLRFSGATGLVGNHPGWDEAHENEISENHFRPNMGRDLVPQIRQRKPLSFSFRPDTDKAVVPQARQRKPLSFRPNY